MTSWVKAGLIGGAALSLIYLSRLVPSGNASVAIALCCVTILAYLLACAGTGALAVRWLPAPRDTGTAAGQGALAGALAGLIGSAVSAVAMLIEFSTMNWADYVSQIPPDMMQWLTSMGVTTEMIQTKPGPLSAILAGGCCGVVGLIIALAVGAIGGVIWAAIRPNKQL